MADTSVAGVPAERPMSPVDYPGALHQGYNGASWGGILRHVPESLIVKRTDDHGFRHWLFPVTASC
jgi:hypothetical protein